jgi:hypothetical protein
MAVKKWRGGRVTCFRVTDSVKIFDLEGTVGMAIAQ